MTYETDIGTRVADAYRRGQTAHLLGDFPSAARAYAELLELAPRNRAVSAKAALMAWHLRDRERARRLLAWYLEGYPNDTAQWYNLAKFEQDEGRPTEAAALYQHALSLCADQGRPPLIEAACNLGLCYSELGRDADAEAMFDLALSFDATSAESKFNRSMVRLVRGDFGGWQDYEARMECASFQWSHERQDLGGVAWKGEPLWDGAVLLVHTEQGLGDVIQFARFVPQVRAMAAPATVRLEVPETLLRLFRSAWPDLDIVARGVPLAPFDVKASIMSLPALCGVAVETVPPPVPFAAVETHIDLAAHVHAPAEGRPRIGIAWAGSRLHPRNTSRSMGAADVRALFASVPGVCWFSLQVGPDESELREAGEVEVAEGSTVIWPGDAFRDFGDTAMLLRELDLVVTIDTSVAHMAGSLGVPTLLCGHVAPEWRWMNRATTPWYESVRMVKQSRPNDWSNVLDAVATAINQFREVAV